MVMDGVKEKSSWIVSHSDSFTFGVRTCGTDWYEAGVGMVSRRKVPARN
jgi:hypothetical protein